MPTLISLHHFFSRKKSPAISSVFVRYRAEGEFYQMFCGKVNGESSRRRGGRVGAEQARKDPDFIFWKASLLHNIGGIPLSTPKRTPKAPIPFLRIFVPPSTPSRRSPNDHGSIPPPENQEKRHPSRKATSVPSSSNRAAIPVFSLFIFLLLHNPQGFIAPPKDLTERKTN